MYALLLLLPLFGFTDSHLTYKITCNGVIFNHVYYDKKLLVSNYGKPINLMYHKYGSTIYFSHTVKKNQDVDFIITSCNVEKKTCLDIEEVEGGYAIGYDIGNDDIYFGGHDGLYKYNIKEKRAFPYAEQGRSIWAIMIRQNFYYIEYPTQRLMVYNIDQFVPVAESKNFEIDHFFMSKFGDVYFANKTALFKVVRPARDIILLDEEVIIRQISEDKYGDIYFCSNDGIYIENKPYDRLKKVAHIHDAFGVTFDEHDHLIYSDKDSIFRLVESPNAKICYDALKDHDPEGIQ